MKFGAVSLSRALGAVLAHSQALPDRRLSKGHILTREDLTALAKAGFESIVVARLDDTDVEENTAAATLAAPLKSAHIRLSEPFSGRVNLIAQIAGVFRVDANAINAFNAVNEAVTIATLPDYARAHQGALLATIKIIPYAAQHNHIQQALAAIGPSAMALHPFVLETADLILTKTKGFKPSLLAKGETAVRNRLLALGLTLKTVQTVAHSQTAIKDALLKCTADMTLILGASATSDRADEAPAALIGAEGELIRFGMPVDPGNLLFLGNMKAKPVIGLPGCARAPALNGADWVLERIAASLPVTNTDIAAMGVGGLLKEVPARPQPRRAPPLAKGRPHILLLAAGRSSRMRGENKLLRQIDGEPLLLRAINTLKASNAGGLTVAIDPANTEIMALAETLNIPIAKVPDARTGLSASLRAGLAAVPADATAVIVALADMPDVTTEDINALIAAHNPKTGALICAPVAPNGKRGNPVLFDRRYFEVLAGLTGDTGAKSLIDAESDALIAVPCGAGVLIDLDTPEAWAEWQAKRANL